jgi:hypothetical protein
MSRVVRNQRRQQEGLENSERDGSLPLRWALILIAAIGAGFAVGALFGPVEGITVGLAVVGVLHKILPRN